MPEEGIRKKIMNCIFLSQRLYNQTVLEVFIEDAAKHQVIVTAQRYADHSTWKQIQKSP